MEKECARKSSQGKPKYVEQAEEVEPKKQKHVEGDWVEEQGESLGARAGPQTKELLKNEGVIISLKCSGVI